MAQSRTASLRQHLRHATQPLHDRLDSQLGPRALDGGPGYAEFLGVQYAARAPIDAWAAANLPADLRPPEAAPALLRDLAALGIAPPAAAPFRFPAGGDPLGLVWAIAGSSLGNGALLVRRRKRGLGGAEAFLSDPAQAAFFARIAPLLETEIDADTAAPAVAAAAAVFACYLAALARVDTIAEAA